MVHPDIQCLQEVTFHVTSHEGSVVLSYATTLALRFIQPCTSLDCLPSSTSLITSCADHPFKTKSQRNVQVSKPCHTVCTSKEQSPTVLPSHDYDVYQCVAYQNQDNPSKWWYPATITSLCADKNCQSTQCEHMQSVKLAMPQANHMQSVKPAMPQASHMTNESDREN